MTFVSGSCFRTHIYWNLSPRHLFPWQMFRDRYFATLVKNVAKKVKFYTTRGGALAFFFLGNKCREISVAKHLYISTIRTAFFENCVNFGQNLFKKYYYNCLNASFFKYWNEKIWNRVFQKSATGYLRKTDFIDKEHSQFFIAKWDEQNDTKIIQFEHCFGLLKRKPWFLFFKSSVVL